MNRLPVVQAAALATAESEERWMIDARWLRRAAGVIGGPRRRRRGWLRSGRYRSLRSASPCGGSIP